MTNRLSLVLAVALCACAADAPKQPRMVHDTAGRSELGNFMKTAVNPPFSKLSFLLFHSDAEDGGSVSDNLPTAASELARAATTLSAWGEAPSESEQGKSVFYDYAQALKTDAMELETAVRTNRKEVAVKAFESLRRKCDSCHHFFRYAEAGE